jgi:hypothetical protein
MLVVALLIMGGSCSVFVNNLETTAESECRFVKKYLARDILSNSSQFFQDYLRGESGHFSAAVDSQTGMTLDGYGLNYSTGELLQSDRHYWSAASKESLHIALLALSLNNNTDAQMVVNRTTAIA